MTIAALGTWRHPPLVYVVAELVISPYYSMTSKLPDLQDRLRKSFPRTIESNELIVDGNKPTTQTMWQLMSTDRTHGVQIGTRVISLHATSYAQSSEFLNRWAEILDAVQAAELEAFVERAGLRYIDLIVPSEGKTPVDYLAEKLQGITLDGGQSTGSMWAAAFQFDGSILNLRTAAPAPHGMLLPPDFNALPLAMPEVMVAANRRLKSELTTGYIDTDCLREIGRIFDASELVGIYSDMQKLTSKTFQAALSKIALQEWM